MENTDNKSAFEQLNLLGARWVMHTEGNEAVWIDQLMETEGLVYTLAFEQSKVSKQKNTAEEPDERHQRDDDDLEFRYDAADKVIAEIEKNMFQPESSRLGEFVSSRLKLRMKDVSRKIQRQKKHIEYSLDEPVGDEEDNVKEETADFGEGIGYVLPENEYLRKESAEESGAALARMITSMSASVLNLEESILRENAGAHRKVQLRNMQLCYTEKISGLARVYDLKTFHDEKNICSAVYQDYFCWFAECDGPCDSIDKLRNSPTKTEGQIIPGEDPDKKITWDEKDLFLPVKVPQNFGKRKLGKTIDVTKIRREYTELIRGI